MSDISLTINIQEGFTAISKGLTWQTEREKERKQEEKKEITVA